MRSTSFQYRIDCALAAIGALAAPCRECQRAPRWPSPGAQFSASRAVHGVSATCHPLGRSQTFEGSVATRHPPLLAAMAQAEAAKALANLLSKVAKYSVVLGLGASALQSSLYTGASSRRSHTARPEALEAVHGLGCLIPGGAGAPRHVAGTLTRRCRRRRPPLLAPTCPLSPATPLRSGWRRAGGDVRPHPGCAGRAGGRGHARAHPLVPGARAVPGGVARAAPRCRLQPWRLQLRGAAGRLARQLTSLPPPGRSRPPTCRPRRAPTSWTSARGRAPSPRSPEPRVGRGLGAAAALLLLSRSGACTGARALACQQTPGARGAAAAAAAVTAVAAAPAELSAAQR